VSAGRATLAGFCASLVGIGLARFAYTPLIPPLVEAGWFAPGAAAYLGAANLAGYLAGALTARWVAARLEVAFVLRAMMLLAAAAFLACSAPSPFAWFFIWRFAAGAAGGVLMVLAAPAVLPLVPLARRGLASGLIFTGVGLGIAASGTLVPLLLAHGLTVTWLGLGAVCLALTAIAWSGWPRHAAMPRPAITQPMRGPGLALGAICIAYALNAAGLVPHMVFLVDFVARGLGRGLEEGAVVWVLFGLAAMAGPVLAGALADRIGFAAAVSTALILLAAAVALPAISPHPAAIALSSIVAGAFVPGIVPLVLGRVQELAAGDADRQRAAWSLATVAFAVGQAVAAYGFSFLYARTGDYTLMFALGAALLLAAFAILTCPPWRPRS